MRVVVTGSRNLEDYDLVLDSIWGQMKVTEFRKVRIASGGARGADSLAKKISINREVSFTEYVADWEKHGNAAGPIRNRDMIDDFDPDIVLAFPGPKSKGTWDCVKYALSRGIQVLITPVDV